MSDFSFPDLTGSATSSSLPKQNPLLAQASVTDRSDAARLSVSQGSGQAGVAVSAPGGPAPSGMAPPPPRAKPKRQKILYEKGYSQMDWVRLSQTHPDLAGLKGRPRRRDISMAEVAEHCTEEDAWTVLRGRVYNITPYLKFHPGGVPLLVKVAGKDGTELFNKYHAWVNADFLLEKCLVGFAGQQAQQGER